jgi:hypothetical protein
MVVFAKTANAAARTSQGLHDEMISLVMAPGQCFSAGNAAALFFLKEQLAPLANLTAMRSFGS